MRLDMIRFCRPSVVKHDKICRVARSGIPFETSKHLQRALPRISSLTQDDNCKVLQPTNPDPANHDQATR